MTEWNSPDQLTLVNADCLQYSRNHSQTSDILRYEILWQYGGVYLDTDFVCQKNIEPLLEGYDFVGAGERDGIVSAGIIACVPHHPVVGRVMQLIPDRIKSNMHQAKSTGPGVLTEACSEHDVKIYGPRLFYPYHWREKHRRNESFPDAYAVHHWAGSWLDARG